MPLRGVPVSSSVMKDNDNRSHTGTHKKLSWMLHNTSGLASDEVEVPNLSYYY